MTNFQYFILFSAAFSAGGLAFLVKEVPRSQLKIILSFTGAFILGITALHLLPDVFAGHNHVAGYWILAGFFIQLLLERLSRGIEHGHLHPSHSGERVFAFQVLIGLCIHAFLEGIPLAAYPDVAENIHGHQHLFWGIVLHEMPASFTLAALLLLSNFSKKFVLICLFIKCGMAPAGAFLASSLHISPENSVNITALVIGLFLHISTTILFEADSSHHYRIAWTRLAAIFGGVLLAMAG